MPRVKVVLSDDERYHILDLLAILRKGPDFIAKRETIRPGPPKYGALPPGTVSVITHFILKINGWEIMKSHHYRLPDGSVTGGPDPLYMCIDDAVFVRSPR